jgi:hypothetical protein
MIQSFIVRIINGDHLPRRRSGYRQKLRHPLTFLLAAETLRGKGDCEQGDRPSKTSDRAVRQGFLSTELPRLWSFLVIPGLPTTMLAPPAPTLRLLARWPLQASGGGWHR